MSHFTVLVTLPKGTAHDKVEDTIGEILAPYDENTEVEPYREYEDGGPEEFWWVKSVRQAVQDLRDGTGIKPYDPNLLGWSTAASTLTADEQRADLVKEADWSFHLGEKPTWETVAKLYTERYSSEESSRLYYDADSDRAYTLTTYNPESKWDWWSIGGRWHKYFVATQGTDASALIHGRPGAFGSTAPDQFGTGVTCDGGMRGLLDLDAQRDKDATAAAERFDVWDRICEKTPPARSWSEFSSLVEMGMPITEARTEHSAQPRVALARKELDSWGCPVEEFFSGREEYILQARRAAVPGYALITLDREWVAPGRMGWFGMSSEGPGEKEAYRIAVNTYLDGLDPEAWVVVVDCHI
ncbi:hypothetical protein AB0I28_12300 [Phytomonospora sp. NPDC050363]|uniref:hypothetical protein n=1 Tax=Phytomonospora sp. NPDC050363 TaxID=3155642 RepID=UPI0033E9C008